MCDLLGAVVGHHVKQGVVRQGEPRVRQYRRDRDFTHFERRHEPRVRVRVRLRVRLRDRVRFIC